MVRLKSLTGMPKQRGDGTLKEQLSKSRSIICIFASVTSNQSMPLTSSPFLSPAASDIASAKQPKVTPRLKRNILYERAPSTYLSLGEYALPASCRTTMLLQLLYSALDR